MSLYQFYMSIIHSDTHLFNKFLLIEIGKSVDFVSWQPNVMEVASLLNQTYLNWNVSCHLLLGRSKINHFPCVSICFYTWNLRVTRHSNSGNNNKLVGLEISLFSKTVKWLILCKYLLISIWESKIHFPNEVQGFFCFIKVVSQKQHHCRCTHIQAIHPTFCLSCVQVS